MATKIAFFGDTHGAFGDLDRALKVQDADVNIQVGDMALFWHGKDSGFQQGFSKPVHFIDGNHDNHWFLQGKNGFDPSNANWPRNANYIPRATHWDEPISINFIGGAESVDRWRRIEGIDYWKEEIPSYREFNSFLKLPPAKIWVTHTAPIDAVQPIVHFKIDNPVSHALQTIWEQTTHKPEVWFFGHFHIPIDTVIDGTRFVGLPCVHDHEFYHENNLVPIAAHNGVSIQVDDGKVLSIDPV